jgi:two-component system OmpR family response regulator
MKILLIEDDRHIAEFMIKGLQEESFAVDHVADGKQGLHYAENSEYDLIILDIMIPEINGIEICREIRKKELETPVIMVTAREAVKDKISGLKSGADDYITKPFSFDELLARIHAILRRSKGKIIELEYGKLRIDIIAHRVFFGDVEIILRPKEYALLQYLLQNKGQTLSRAQMLENVWGYNFDPATNIVDVYIRALREKLIPCFKKDIIQTVRGSGYMVEDI